MTMDITVHSPRADHGQPQRACKPPVKGQDWDTGAVEVTYGEGGVSSRFNFKRLLTFAGPGLLVAIAFVDPGNLESDLQTGMHAGFSLGWLIVMATLCGYLVQLIVSRLGVAMGKDLAQSIRATFPRAPRLVLWVMTEIAVIGSDIQEVIGSAIAIRLLSGGHIPMWAGVVITGFDTFFLLFLTHLGVRKLEAFFAGLVAVMATSFCVMAFKAGVPADDVLKGMVVPKVESSQMAMAAGIIGCLVMPHNLFLHSALIQTRKINGSTQGAKQEAIMYNAVESGLSVAITVCINICVMAVFAMGFYGLTDEEKDKVGLTSAGRYLGERYGEAVKYIWAIGLLAAGQSSTMTGTYAGQFVMSGFLKWKVAAWKRAIITRSIALVPTLAVAISYSDSSKLDKLNQLLNIVQAIQLPFALLPAIYITTRADLMGPELVIRRAFRGMAYLISVLLLTVNLSVVITQIMGNVESGIGLAIPTLLAAVLYILFVLYLIIGPRCTYALLAHVPGRFSQRLSTWFGDDGDTVFDQMETPDGCYDGDVAAEKPATDGNELGPKDKTAVGTSASEK